MEQFGPYNITILVTGIIALVLLLQLIITDVVALLAKHTPGYPIKADHDSFIFRSARAHANTNETIGTFLALALFGIFSNSNPGWLNVFALVYLIGRIAHMFFYYTDIKIARSISFGISLAGLIGMLITGFMPWIF